MAMGMATVAPMVSVVDNRIAAVYAVDAKAKAKAQREKEKAKQAKEREKAKAKAAKEREKAAAQKKKEQAKAAAQKQKAREQAKAKQAKAQQAKSSSKSASSKSASKPAAAKTQPALTAAEEKAQYLKQVAAIDKANAKATAYNERDIAHRLGFWGEVGYSNLFTSGIQYNPATAPFNTLGFRNKDNGFVGGGFGLGYQLRYKQMIMTVGAEFTLYNSVMDISNNEEGAVLRHYGMQPYPNTMIYSYNFREMQDKIIGGWVQVPILFGMEHKNIPLFWQVGVKAGIGMLGQSTISGIYTTSIEDKELIDGLTDMFNHSLVTDAEMDQPSSKVNFGLNVAATAEIGVNFDRWIKASPRVRASVFVDYGVLNALSFKPATLSRPGAEIDMPVQLLGNDDPLAFTTHSAMASTAAASAKVNPFLVGAKLAVWFDLPRKPKAIQDYPKAPTPRMGIYMYDESNASALGGVAVEITNVETGKVQVLRNHSLVDVGPVGNKLSVDGQAYSGMSHSIGFALSEQFEDINKHKNMIACGIPQIKDIPDDLSVEYIEDNLRPRGPHGSSGCSEIFQSSGHTAVLNAIADACGVRIYDLPATPAKVKAAYEAVQRGEDLTPPKYYIGKEFEDMLDELNERTF